MTTAISAMKPVPSAHALHPARAIPARSRRPSASPTRTVAACAMPHGTMNDSAAICSATACAATASALISPIR